MGLGCWGSHLHLHPFVRSRRETKIPRVRGGEGEHGLAPLQQQFVLATCHATILPRLDGNVQRRRRYPEGRGRTQDTVQVACSSSSSRRVSPASSCSVQRTKDDRTASPLTSGPTCRAIPLGLTPRPNHQGATMAKMQYRRLGRSGLKVSRPVIWQLGHLRQRRTRSRRPKQAAECLAAANEAGVNFFDNAEAYARRRVRARHGRGDSRARLEAPRVRRLDQALLGPSRRPQHAQHPEPQVPHPGHRGIARALRPRLRRPRLLPPCRPQDADRRDGLGDERHGQPRPGPLLGHLGVERRRDPRRLGHRRPPPPPQARRWSSPSTTS